MLTPQPGTVAAVALQIGHREAGRKTWLSDALAQKAVHNGLFEYYDRIGDLAALIDAVWASMSEAEKEVVSWDGDLIGWAVTEWCAAPVSSICWPAARRRLRDRVARAVALDALANPFKLTA